jgi:hypothetical protein
MKIDIVQTDQACYNHICAEQAQPIMIRVDHLGKPYPVLKSDDETFIQGLANSSYTFHRVTVSVYRNGGVKIAANPSGVPVKMAIAGAYGQNPNYDDNRRNMRLETYSAGWFGTIKEFCALAQNNLV